MLVLFGLSACGPQSLITDGSYYSGAAEPLSSSTLVVDTAAKTASLTISEGGDPIVLELSAVPTADWERGCPTNFSSVSVETYLVTPNPVTLGEISLSDARLVAGCGLDEADPDSVVLKGTGEPNATEYFIIFHRS